MKYNYLEFNMEVGRSKPENIIHKDQSCPFCNYKNKEHQEKILASHDDILFINNKYQVLNHSDQFLIIESNQCEIDIPDYTKEHMIKLMDFALKQWFKMLKSQKYSAVLFFKNHGPLSGGSMRHPHMQLVGIKNQHLKMDYMFSPEQIMGIKLAQKGQVTLNLSTRPRVGFYELNIIMNDFSQVEYLAEFIQNSVDFLRNRHSGKANSYNLFFYYTEHAIYVKIIPRYATSPLFIGYNIELIPNDLKETAELFKTLYYPHSI